MWKVHGKLTICVLYNGKTITEATFDKDKITIGRDPACDLVIDNQLVSGRHARITRKDAGYIIEDLGSTNGTLLNGRAIQKEVLRVGAVATIGKHKLELIEEGQSNRAKGAPQETVAPLTDATIVASPAEATRLYAEASLKTFLAAGGKLAELRMEKGKGSPLSLKLTKEMIMVGKDRDADLQLSGMLMPAKAFFIERVKRGYKLVPAAAPKKLTLNGKPVKDKLSLSDGDTISVGSAVLSFNLVS